MNADPADVLAASLDLPGVHSGADLKAKAAERLQAQDSMWAGA
jgi:hypothetical protein